MYSWTLKYIKKGEYIEIQKYVTAQSVSAADDRILFSMTLSIYKTLSTKTMSTTSGLISSARIIT